MRLIRLQEKQIPFALNRVEHPEHIERELPILSNVKIEYKEDNKQDKIMGLAEYNYSINKRLAIRPYQL